MKKQTAAAPAAKRKPQSKHTKRGMKQDRAKISSQPWEIQTTREIFVKTFKGEVDIRIDHPSTGLVKVLVKQLKNVRRDVYAALEVQGYRRTTKRVR